MRILHTADWHLGRSFAGFDLLDAQRHALDGLATIAATERPHAIILAGDIYDRGVPPEDAVREFDDILMRLAAVAPVLAIAGNHDSGGRIDFGRRLLRQTGVHIAGTSRQGIERVDLRDEHGIVAFHLMPFATPEDVRFELGIDHLRSHDEATRARIASLDLAGTARHVLVGHLFVHGGRETRDSERDITVGGVATVDPAAFAPFSYTALGHLHRPHSVAGGRVRYSGSLARYSFAEEDHEKTVSLVEIDAAGELAVREIPLPQKHGMRTLRGTFDELRERAAADGRREVDFVRIVLSDAIMVPGAYEHFRRLYPHLLEFVHEPPRLANNGDRPDPAAARASEREYLDAFFRDRYAGDVRDEVRRLAHQCLEHAVRTAEASG